MKWYEEEIKKVYQRVKDEGTLIAYALNVFGGLWSAIKSVLVVPAIADMFKPDDKGSQFSRKIVAGSKSVAVVLAEDRASIRVENSDGETVRFPLAVDNSSTVRIHYDGKQIEAVEVECLAKSVPLAVRDKLVLISPNRSRKFRTDVVDFV